MSKLIERRIKTMINVNTILTKFGSIENILDKSSFRSNVLLKNYDLARHVHGILSMAFKNSKECIDYFNDLFIITPDYDIRYTMCAQSDQEDILVVVPIMIDDDSVVAENLGDARNIVDTAYFDNKRYIIMIAFLTSDYEKVNITTGLMEMFIQMYGGIHNWRDKDTIMAFFKSVCLVNCIMNEYHNVDVAAATIIDIVHKNVDMDDILVDRYVEVMKYIISYCISKTDVEDYIEGDFLKELLVKKGFPVATYVLC